jgi:hypothetical protein
LNISSTSTQNTSFSSLKNVWEKYFVIFDKEIKNNDQWYGVYVPSEKENEEILKFYISEFKNLGLGFLINDINLNEESTPGLIKNSGIEKPEYLIPNLKNNDNISTPLKTLISQLVYLTCSKYTSSIYPQQDSTNETSALIRTPSLSKECINKFQSSLTKEDVYALQILSSYFVISIRNNILNASTSPHSAAVAHLARAGAYSTSMMLSLFPSDISFNFTAGFFF